MSHIQVAARLGVPSRSSPLPLGWRGWYGLHSLKRLVLTVNNRTVHARVEIPKDLGWFWQST